MTNKVGSAVVRALEHGAAARHGRQAGRAGLSVDEVADTRYHVGLRRRLQDERAAIDIERDRELAELEASARDAEAKAAGLRTRADQVVAQAQAAARACLDRYDELCAVYGAHWQRTHRDRAFAHIGWRCPRPPDPLPAEEE